MFDDSDHEVKGKAIQLAILRAAAMHDDGTDAGAFLAAALRRVAANHRGVNCPVSFDDYCDRVDTIEEQYWADVFARRELVEAAAF